jgi:hypothetical protein
MKFWIEIVKNIGFYILPTIILSTFRYTTTIKIYRISFAWFVLIIHLCLQKKNGNKI